MTQRPDLTPYLGQSVHVVIDRALGTRHPRHPDIIYPVNYGFLPATVSGDGMDIDAYVVGIDTPVAEANGRVVAVVVRADDAEDKLIVAADDRRRSVEELWEAVAFQERFFDARIVAGPTDKNVTQ